LGGTESEDVAMMLLQAGGLGGLDGADQGFVRYARDQHWDRVIAWLKANGSE
jgi:hypothetical protein